MIISMTAIRIKSGFSRISRCRTAGRGGVVTSRVESEGASFTGGDGESGEIDGYDLRAAAASVGRDR